MSISEPEGQALQSPTLLLLHAVSRADKTVTRTIITPSSVTFVDLHNALTAAFEFGGEQYASFYMHDSTSDKGYCQIPLFDTDDDFLAKRCMFDTTLGDHLKEKGQTFLYIYDFVLMWEFEMEVVEVLDHKIEEPVVISSTGTLPERYGHMEEYPESEDEMGEVKELDFSGSSLDIEGDDSLMEGWDEDDRLTADGEGRERD